MYNHKYKSKVEKREGRDSLAQFHHLADAKNYFVDVQADGDFVTHFFCAHPEGIQILKAYPNVVGIDATYKTNTYNMPLVEFIAMTPCNKNILLRVASCVTRQTQAMCGFVAG